jgi:hypothetical protein
MTKKLQYFFPLLLMLVLVVSACKQNNGLSVYYNDNSVSGAGNGNSNSCCCCNQATPTCDSTITVLDANGSPVPNATVTVYGTATQIYTTDGNGQVFATQLTDGEYIVKVVIAGYENDLDLFTVTDNECPVVDVELNPVSTCSGVFTIQDAVAPNSAITFASMTINGQSYTANSSGVINVPDLADGTYPYTITAAGYYNLPTNAAYAAYNTVTGDYTVSNDSCPDLSVPLTCSYTNLVIEVDGPTGAPVLGKQITLIFDGVTSYPTTDGNGDIVIPNVAPGGHTCTVTYSM